MARLVRHEATGPIKIDPAAAPGTPGAWPRDAAGNLKPVFVCACGVSAKFPFCDGNHKACMAGEEAGYVYRYQPGTTTVVDRQPDPG